MAQLPVKITIVRPECGDWEALYINRVLVYENHRIDAHHLLERLKDWLPIEVQDVGVTDEFAEAGMPETWED